MLERELGGAASARLLGRRAECAARDLRLEAALVAAEGLAREARCRYAVLKGGALALTGRAPESGRPASDLDLLVPARRLAELQARFVSAGFRAPSDAGYEHQAPLLLHPAGGAVELHRALPGVCLEPRRWARFEALERAGLLEKVPGRAGRELELARVPARSVLVAHALVHSLAQHAFVAAHRGFSLVADLVDLGALDEREVTASRAWIGRDVDLPEARAAIALAAHLAAGDLDFLSRSEQGTAQLAAHFVACALDARYGLALRSRSFERPLSERPLWRARLAVLERALAPPGVGWAGRLRRPFDLLVRWRRSRRAARR